MELMKSLRLILSAAIFLIAVYAPSIQAKVIYDESVSGDLPGIGEPEFILEEGVNSLFGSSCMGELELGCPTVDSDSVSFELGSGLQLDSIAFRAFDAILDQRNVQAGVSYWFYAVDAPPPITVTSSKPFRIAEQGFQESFETLLPLGSGRYRLASFLFGPYYAGTVSNWSYEVQLRVSSVPSTSTFLLLLFPCLVAFRSRTSPGRRLS